MVHLKIMDAPLPQRSVLLRYVVENVVITTSDVSDEGHLPWKSERVRRSVHRPSQHQSHVALLQQGIFTGMWRFSALLQ